MYTNDYDNKPSVVSVETYNSTQQLVQVMKFIKRSLGDIIDLGNTKDLIFQERFSEKQLFFLEQKWVEFIESANSNQQMSAAGLNIFNDSVRILTIINSVSIRRHLQQIKNEYLFAIDKQITKKGFFAYPKKSLLFSSKANLNDPYGYFVIYISQKILDSKIRYELHCVYVGLDENNLYWFYLPNCYGEISDGFNYYIGSYPPRLHYLTYEEMRGLTFKELNHLGPRVFEYHNRL